MKVREQVDVCTMVPIELWNAAIHRDVLWSTPRAQCATQAASRGMVLANDGTESKTFMFERCVDGADGQRTTVECTEDQAEYVHLRLATWAVPKET